MPVLQTRTIATPKSSADLLAAIRRFLDDLAPDVRPTHACFAIAGPIDAMRRMGSVTNIESLDIDAAAFGEALEPGFKTYQAQVIKNAQALADELMIYKIGCSSNGRRTVASAL